jgi:hypothetical protein
MLEFYSQRLGKGVQNDKANIVTCICILITIFPKPTISYFIFILPWCSRGQTERSRSLTPSEKEGTKLITLYLHIKQRNLLLFPGDFRFNGAG